MKRIIGLVALLSVSQLASATGYYVYNTQIRIYAGSKSDGNNTAIGDQAQLIGSSVGIYQGGNHPWCGDRAYILPEDKELYAAALAAAVSKTPVNFLYDDASPPRHAPGHIAGFRCKVISIFQ